MKKLWEVTCGEYSDAFTAAVCSSEEQAMGVAVKVGGYVSGTVEFWEPDDGIPPYRPLYHCIVRTGADSHKPLDVDARSEPIGLDVTPPPPTVRTGPGPNPHGFRWAVAENYLDATEAERDARAAYEALR